MVLFAFLNSRLYVQDPLAGDFVYSIAPPPRGCQCRTTPIRKAPDEIFPSVVLFRRRKFFPCRVSYRTLRLALWDLIFTAGHFSLSLGHVVLSPLSWTRGQKKRTPVRINCFVFGSTSTPGYFETQSSQRLIAVYSKGGGVLSLSRTPPPPHRIPHALGVTCFFFAVSRGWSGLEYL